MSDPLDFQSKFAARADDIAARWRARLGDDELSAETGLEGPAPPPVDVTEAVMAEAVAAAEAASPAPAPAELQASELPAPPSLSADDIHELEQQAHDAEVYAAVVGLFDPERMADICRIADPLKRGLFLTRLSSVCNETIENGAVRWFLKSDPRRAHLKSLAKAEASRVKDVIRQTEGLTTGAPFDVALRNSLRGRSPSLWSSFREGTDEKKMRFAAQQFVAPRNDFNNVAAPLRTELQREERRAGDSRFAFLRRGRDSDSDLKTLRDFVTGPGQREAEVMLLQGGSGHERSDLLRRLVRDLAPKADTPVVVLSLDRPILASDHGLRRDIAIQAPALAPQLLGDGVALTTVPKGVSRLVLVCDKADQMAEPEAGDAPFVSLQRTICEVFGPRLRVILAGTPSPALKHAICPDPHVLDLDGTA